MNLVLMMGPQGSGKGTVATRLAQEYGMVHVSTGDLIRAEIKSGTDLGKRVEKIINEGKLLDDELMLSMLKQHLAKQDGKRGVLLDGFPRNIGQAKALNKKFKVACILELDVPDQVAVQRISGRVQCKKCGEIYGVKLPPKKKGICDKCGGLLATRDDDKPEAVKARLKIYHETTKPILALYGDKVQRIDAAQDLEDVMASAREALSQCENTYE
jgi:adenylate kinase